MTVRRPAHADDRREGGAGARAAELGQTVEHLTGFKPLFHLYGS